VRLPRPLPRPLPRSVYGWIATVAVAACLPPDQSTERGAVYIHLSASALSVRDEPDLNGFTHDVTFERLTIVAGGDAVGCKVLYYVERTSSAAAAIDFLRPFTIERRSLRDKSCPVVAGIIDTKDEPFVGDGVGDDDVRLLSQGGKLQLGGLHAIAHVRYPIPPGPEGFTVDRRIDVVLFDVTGSAETPSPVPVPPGGKSDVVVMLSTDAFALALLAASDFDSNGDGIVTTEELPPSFVDTLRVAASDKWSIVAAP
jgi:hypothetical protein